MPDTVTDLPIDSVTPSRRNPRRRGKSRRDMKNLVRSVLALGVLQPILVRRDGERFEVIAGERRWLASKMARLPTVPAIIRENVADQDAMEMTVTENLQREGLHPLEEAEGVAALLGKGWEVKAIADRIGRSPTWVARRAHLTNLSPAWRKRVGSAEDILSEWSGAHLDLVARLDPAVQDELLETHIASHVPSIAELERRLADLTQEVRLAPWKPDDESLVPDAGPCSACPKTSGYHPGLFDDEVGQERKAGGRCLDQGCWRRKLAAHVERRRAELTEKNPELVVVNGRNAYNDGGDEKLPSAHDFEKVKKSTPGARLIFVARGSDAGQSFWGKPYSSSGGGGRTKKTNGPLNKKEKEDRLDLRRQAHAVNAAKEALEKLDATPPADLVLALAAVYGTKHRCDTPGLTYAHPADGGDTDDASRWRQSDPWDLFLRLKDAPEEVSGALWRSTLKVLLHRWTWNTLDGVEAAAKEAFALSELLGLDVAALKADAEKAIPTPKAWGAPAVAKRATRKKGGRKRC